MILKFDIVEIRLKKWLYTLGMVTSSMHGAKMNLNQSANKAILREFLEPPNWVCFHDDFYVDVMVINVETCVGATIVDSLDTLYIMGLKDEFEKAVSYVRNELDLNNIDSEVSVFEMNIRFVGGLLSCYAFTKDPLFLDKAEQFAKHLLIAFDTPTGIPHALINPQQGHHRNYFWASSGCSILSEAGTLHLEFLYLSEVTGNPIYKEKVFAIRNHLDKMPKINGLYPNYIDPNTGQWGQRKFSS